MTGYSNSLPISNLEGWKCHQCERPATGVTLSHILETDDVCGIVKKPIGGYVYHCDEHEIQTRLVRSEPWLLSGKG